MFVNLLKAKQPQWTPPKFHPLPETAQHLQSAGWMYTCKLQSSSKLQPSHKSYKPMWKYSYTDAYLYTKYILVYHTHESHFSYMEDLHWSVNRPMAPNDHCRGTVVSGPGAASAAMSWIPGHAYTGTVSCLQMWTVRCHVCLISLVLFKSVFVNLFKAKEHQPPNKDPWKLQPSQKP